MSKAEKVFVATSQEELEAIWRFRYEVYVEELKRDYPGVDHDRQVAVSGYSSETTLLLQLDLSRLSHRHHRRAPHVH